MTCSGLVHALRVARAGYPHHLSLADFARQYGWLPMPDGLVLRKGKTRVFLDDRAMQVLGERRQRVEAGAARLVAVLRGRQTRAWWARVQALQSRRRERSATTLQHAVRTWLAARRHHKEEPASPSPDVEDLLRSLGRDITNLIACEPPPSPRPKHKAPKGAESEAPRPAPALQKRLPVLPRRRNKQRWRPAQWWAAAAGAAAAATVALACRHLNVRVTANRAWAGISLEA